MQTFFKNRKLPVIVFFLIIFSVLMIPISGCRSSKEQRHAYKMQHEAAKKGAKEHEALIKAHYDHQAANTKQMMKEMKKENKKLKKSKKRSLRNRVFHRNCR